MWLGALVVVLNGVKIGKGSVVGASSVLTKDIPYSRRRTKLIYLKEDILILKDQRNLFDVLDDIMSKITKNTVQLVKKKSLVSIVTSDSDTIDTKKSVKRAIELIGGMDQIVKKGDSVLIKPNFVAPFSGAVTNFNIIEEVVEEVRKCGGEPILGESAGFEFDTEKTFDIIGATKFAQNIGVKLVNFDAEHIEKIKVNQRFLKELIVPKIVLDTDVLINLPKMKMHGITTVSFGMKNLMGIPNRKSRRKLHVLGIGRGIVTLNTIFKPDLTIVDGLTMVESKAVYGNELDLGVIVAGKDVVSVDQVCCELIGIKPQNIKHIRYAIKMGLEQGLPEIVGDFNEVNKISVSEEKTLHKLMHNALFRGMYAADSLYSILHPNKSLIPSLHWHMGIQPKIDQSKCDKCGICVDICPIKAIDAETFQIESKKCMYVRCLKCAEFCPAGAIDIKRRW